MRNRIVLAIAVIALTTGGVSLPAQEMPQPQIANWPAPAFWEPPARNSGGLGTETALAVSSSSPTPFIAVTPCRVVDTRLSGGAFGVGETRSYAMVGGTLPCVSGFPAGIVAVSLNITVTQTAGTGFVTAYPAFSSLPVVATLTWIGANQTLSNAAVVPVGFGGIGLPGINIHASQMTHVILDVNGFYASAAVGDTNTFLGRGAGISSTTGSENTGIGDGALESDTSGNFNTAIGSSALLNNATGNNNTAVGNFALRLNSSGSTNTAVGDSALSKLFSGIGNIAIGAGACSNNTSGNDNICIHSDGVDGDSNTIRIGRFFHSAAFIGGITGVTVTGAPVLVSSSGQLGVASSSRSIKDDIREIAEQSDDLMKLRPVAFRYKPEIDPAGLIQYGLIAEEVAEVYPDLVVSDRNGKPQTVRYHLINALLLNEVQKQHRTIEAQQTEIEDLKARQQAEIERLKADLSALRALVSQH